MQAAVNRLAVLSASVALLIPPGVALAEAEGEVSAPRGADRWVPSLAPIFGATFQQWEGDLASQICRNCTFPSPMSTALRPAVSGDDRDVTPFFGGELELMTPELPLPTRPRLFVGGEVAATFGVDRTIASEGDPSSLSSPYPPGTVNQPYDENTVLGQGSETIATMGSPLYGAYAGVAFPFSLYGRQLRVKPAFAWLRYSVDVEGTVLDAECLDRPTTPTNLCNTIPASGTVGIQRAIQMTGSDSGTFDGIGPGLDLEMDTGAFGAFGTSIFIGGRAYHLLGDRTVEFDSSASFPDEGLGLPASETRAQWSYEAQPWIYRVFVGVRLQWLGPR